MKITDEQADGSHAPSAGDPDSWQESWYLLWHDPSRRAGGSYHVGAQRKRGRADVWNWTALDGELVGHFQSLALPVPADISEMKIGHMDITTVTPLREYRLATTYPTGGVSANLDYTAFTDAFAFGLDGQGVEIGSNHYESFGKVTGTVTSGPDQIEVSGWGFQDHSWGPRDWNSLRSHRWVCATFGEELFFSVATFVTGEGQRASGYVFDGEFRGVSRVSFGTRIADDGHTPEGCDIRIWTVDGKGYHLTGTTEASGVSSHDNGWFATDALTVFEMGGRLGTGMVQVSELKGLAPWHEVELGLSTDGGK